LRSAQNYFKLKALTLCKPQKSAECGDIMRINTPKMTETTTAQMDDAYANGAYIEGAENYPDQWAKAAAEFRSTATAELDIPYGPSARERFDLFLPTGDPKGLFVFIHGGYWLDFDKSSWSHLAQGAVANGWAAMVPSYGLCPDVYITEITRQIGASIDKAASRIDGPIVLTGHSAGGHLAARMICEGTPLAAATAARIIRSMGISGLYDLAPLMQISMNKTLRINEVEAIRESPAKKKPLPGAKFLAWVGSKERPEFRRQSRILCDAWSGASVFYVEDEGRHHFDVFAGLSDPDSAIVKAALGL